MQTILTVFHLFLAIGLVGLVLIQHGKGADVGAAFGSGASSTVFGARGSASFLTRATGGLATLFFLTSMALAYFASQTGDVEGLMDKVPAAPATQVQAPPIPEIPVPAVPRSEVPQVPAPSVPAAEVAAPAVPAPSAEAPATPGEQK